MLFCRTLMILVSHHDDTLMTGPSPVVSHKVKHNREKEPYSDDESEKLNNNGGKGRRFYIDVVSDRRPITFKTLSSRASSMRR